MKSESLVKSESLGFFLGLIGVSAFSLTLPITRFLTGSLSALEIGLGRSMLAVLVAILILCVTRQSIPTTRQIRKLLLTSCGIVFGFPILTAIGMQTVPASHGAIVLGALPLATTIFSCFLSGEKPSCQFWLVSMAGFAIIIIYAVSNADSALNIAFYVGDLALIGAVVLAGLGYAQGGILARNLGGWQVICWTLVVSLPILLPLVFLFCDIQNFSAMDRTSWGAFIFLALVNSLIGFFFWYQGLAIGGIARVSQTQYFQPFMTVLFSFILLREEIEIMTIMFLSAMVLVVMISKKMPVHHQYTKSS